MKLTHWNLDGMDVLELEGRFDAQEAPAVVQWFEQYPRIARLIVNLKGVTFIDSMGLSTLVKGLKRCRQNGGDLVLCELQQSVVLVIQLTRLDKAFSVYPDAASALAALRA